MRTLLLSRCQTKLLGVLLTCSLTSGLADDWPNWRGPHHNGISEEKGWFAPWPSEGPRQIWRVTIGTGFSSVAVSEGRLFAMGNAPGKLPSETATNLDTVFCLDAATGKELWRHSYPCPLDPNFYEGGPSATPTVDAGRVYTLSKHGQVFCFDAASGKIHWQRNLMAELGVKKPDWGFASSPRVDEGRLLFNVGDAGLALDKRSGQVIWKSGSGPAAYATPVVFEAGGKRRAAFLGHRDLFCVDTADGQLWWRLPWKTAYDMSVPDVVVVEGGLFVSSFDQPGRLLELKGAPPGVVWENKDFFQHINPVVAVAGSLYGFHGDATESKGLKCVDTRTGREKWHAPGLVCGALMAADGKLIALTGKGELIVAEATPEAFRPLARAQVLAGKCWTVPVLANGRIYCRNVRGDLVCLAANGQ